VLWLRSPLALSGVAVPVALTETLSAVISPLNRFNVVTSVDAVAVAIVPLSADTLSVAEAAEATVPSAGYANAPPNWTASCGAESVGVPLLGSPGTRIWSP